MELEFLKALVIIFGVSALSVFLLNRIKIPPLVGFIVAGVLIGPNGLGLIQDLHEIEIFAEVGVILLLFTIGIEFSLKTLMRLRRSLLFAGAAQVILAIGLTALATFFFTHDLRTSMFFGFLVALSSTAIVLKLLADRGETETPQGRAMIAVLILQDLFVVPLMLLTPMLGGEDPINVLGVAKTMLTAGAIIVMVFLGSRWIVPVVLHQVVHTKSRELFIVSIILICLGIALITSKFGLSLALGAFIAGLIISESEYAYAVTAEILPLKESFMAMFFISIGMLVDISLLFTKWPQVLSIIGAIFIIKSVSVIVPVYLATSSVRHVLHIGIGLSQVGEFSFILAEVGKASGLISLDEFQLFLSAAVTTMALTPAMLTSAPILSRWLASRGPLQRIQEASSDNAYAKKLSGHTIIIGFGVNGRNLAYTLKKSNFPYVILELNAATVLKERQKDEPIIFGDGASPDLLRKLGIHRAAVLVIAISDPATARKIVALARKENSSLHIIVRTRLIAEVKDLRALGANEIIPEEFETSIELFARVLHHYNVPRNIINTYIDDIRKNEYEAFRTHGLPLKTFHEMKSIMGGIHTETYLINDNSDVAGHTLRELRLRANTGATVIAVERTGEIHQNPSPDFVLQAGDILLLVGKKEDIAHAREYLDSDSFLTEKY